MLNKIKRWAHRLKQEITAIYIASKDARTPRVAKVVALCVAAYAFSPIDLIPDFIPVLGLLDDLIIIPAGIALIVRLIPQDLMTSFRLRAKSLTKPSSNRAAGMLIISIWIVLIVVAARIVSG